MVFPFFSFVPILIVVVAVVVMPAIMMEQVPAVLCTMYVCTLYIEHIAYCNYYARLSAHRRIDIPRPHTYYSSSFQRHRRLVHLFFVVVVCIDRRPLKCVSLAVAERCLVRILCGKNNHISVLTRFGLSTMTTRPIYGVRRNEKKRPIERVTFIDPSIAKRQFN